MTVEATAFQIAGRFDLRAMDRASLMVRRHAWPVETQFTLLDGLQNGLLTAPLHAPLTGR